MSCVRNAGGSELEDVILLPADSAYDIAGGFRRYPEVANEELLGRGNHSSALKQTLVCMAQNIHFWDRSQ